MKELAYETTDKQKKGFLSGLCDMGSENVIILATHFCKVVTGFK